MKSLSNVSLREFRAVLLLLGLKKVRTKGGHEAWMRAGMSRPVIFQTHKDPVPEFVLRNNLRSLGMSKSDFLSLLDDSAASK